MAKPKKPIREPFSQKEIEEMVARIKEIRKKLSLTGNELSLSLGFHKSYISQIEIGTIPPTSSLIGLLYKLYNVNPNYILLGFKPIFFSNEPIKRNVINNYDNDSEKILSLTDDDKATIEAFQKIVKRMNATQIQKKTKNYPKDNAAFTEDKMQNF